MTERMKMILFATLLAGVFGTPARTDDWPTYRKDSQRSGISNEELKAPLSESWVFTANHPPSKAWGDPQPKPIERILELPRLRFDDAFQVVAAGDLVFFGSSADHKVYALEAQTGNLSWEFTTEGPVRLAPTVWKDRVYVGSDDGSVYCLEASSGRAVWKFMAAPDSQKLLGNGKMISLWPVRTGVLVEDGVAYFGAGVFPAEGLFLYAVDAGNGELLWKNNTYGAGGMANISPQGYLLASKDRLFVPSARAMPAAFSRQDGRFLFHPAFSWRGIGLFGGTYSVLQGDLLFNATEQVLAIRERDGRLDFAEGLAAATPSQGTRRLVVDTDVIYMLTGKEAIAADREGWIQLKKLVPLRKARDDLKKRAKSNKDALKQLEQAQKRLDDALAALKAKGDPIRWQVSCDCTASLVLTRGMLFAGGAGKVLGLDRATGATAWTAQVNGRARGMAVSGGRLLVTTDKGSIHCFVGGSEGPSRVAALEITPRPFPEDRWSDFYVETAKDVVSESGVQSGYALILGGGNGRLALELARRTDLMITTVDSDLAAVAAARKALTAAGVYGPGVVATHAPLDALPYADYFANLIVCQSGFFSGKIATPAREVLRMLKPCGGVAYIGRPPGAAMDTTPPVGSELRKWLIELLSELAHLGEEKTTINIRGEWVKITRGPLQGAGSWTHQYAEPGNSACSDDQLVRGSLGILWYGEPGPERIPSRHASNVAPLAVGGRMFIEGENVLMAYDAYNGLLLWQRDIPGAMRLRLKTGCSNMAANENSLFVAIGNSCHRLDAATGRTLKTYQAPPADDGGAGEWIYVACVNDLLFGSRDSDGVFAVSIETGELLWTYTGKSIMKTTTCIGDGRLFLVDRSVTPEQEKQALDGVPAESRVDRRGKPVKPDVRLVVALDTRSGKKMWESPQYMSDCVGISKGGGDLTAMYAKGVFLLCGQPWNGHFWPEFFSGEFSRRSLIALAGDDGRPLWSGRKGYRSRPLIVGDRVIAEPWAHDLATGTEKVRKHPVTGAVSKWQMARPGHHCGNIAASPHALFYRSGTAAYYDLDGDYGTAHFAGQRSGCWINCIPAGGVVLMPEASSGCVCPYALHCTTVFKPRETNRVWGMYSAAGPITPVNRLAINFGAPGDRRDSAGKLWLAYPRPRGGATPVDRRLVLHLPLVTETAEGGGFQNRGADFLEIEGTRDDWIYASGSTGLTRCSIPLNAKDEAPVAYTVRLHFTETENDRSGQRVFNVRLGDQTVLNGFDIVKEAGGPRRAVVKEFRDIQAGQALKVVLEVVKGQPSLCGLEILAQER